MKRHTKLGSAEQQQSQQAELEQQKQQPAAVEFATPEELLRHDAAHTVVPPSLTARLQQSTAALPRPARSWWQRLFRPGSS